ncbi:conserved hypothetical protein [Acidobacteriia bacterium SbA2]|nr:conserved hypothetical protein [Acidobacteriia bacterium SbA2]
MGITVNNKAQKPSHGLNPAERFVYELSRKSFLSLWSYANPRREIAGKELCDVLVVCSPDVIIISVKEIRLGDSTASPVEFERWRRRAIEESVKQLYGAERNIPLAVQVVRADNSLGVQFPPTNEARIHRVAVGVGSKGVVPLSFGDFGKGFVHVFDGTAFHLVLSELDTIEDFVHYLSAKEQFCRRVKELIQTREEDLLAIYLHGGRRFPDPPDVLVTPDYLWETIQKKPEYQNRKRADKISYEWDRLIQRFARDALSGNLEPGSSPTSAELGLRTMARENRFSRRILGAAFKEVLDESRRTSLARMLVAPSGVVYVFFAAPRGYDRQVRQAELANRCFVARGLNPSSTTVIGVATERYDPRGYSLDLCQLFLPRWTPEHQSEMAAMQTELGYFVSPRKTVSHEDEYPETTGT